MTSHTHANTTNETHVQRLGLPTWAFILSLIALIWNALGTLRGAVLGGISWDEPNHVWMLQGWFDFGYYSERMTTPEQRNFVFGPVADLLGHTSAVLLGLEDWGAPSLSAPSYFARHLTTALVSLIAVAAVAGIVRVLLDSWRWGLMAGAMLTSIPMWSGLAMFDQKDVTTAAGISACSLGVVLLIGTGRVAKAGRFLLAGVLVSTGIVLAGGTRVATLVLIIVVAAAALSLAFVVIAGQWGIKRAARTVLCWLAVLVAAAGAGYAVLSMIYPLVFTDPMSTLLPSTKQSSDFNVYPYRPPKTYILEWFLLQTPLVIASFSVLGLVASVMLVTRTVRRRHLTGSRDIRYIGLVVVLVQALAVPIFAVAVSAILYHSLRHLLFIYPAVAVLATVGVYASLIGLRRGNQRSSKFASGAVLAVALAGVVIPTVDQARLFPYAYAYFNPVARIIGIEGRWATDYWRTSWRELYTQISTNDFAVCPDSIHFPDDTMYGWPVDQSFSCEYETKVNPFFTKPPAYDSSTGHFWFLRENTGEIYVPKNCRLHSRVTRPLGLGDITLSYLEYCHYVPAPSQVKN